MCVWASAADPLPGNGQASPKLPHVGNIDQNVVGPGFQQRLKRFAFQRVDGGNDYVRATSPGRAEPTAQVGRFFAMTGLDDNQDHRVALGLHQAIVDRVGGMVRRTGVAERFIFAGGVAQNRCLQQLFSEALGVPLTVPGEPQTVGALGAALYGVYS